jgi:hypothetical protein
MAGEITQRFTIERLAKLEAKVQCWALPRC